MYDTLRNTGQWKTLAVELLINLIMPYPFFNDFIYYENYTNGDGEDHVIEFRVNWILLCLMTFIRLYQVIKCLLYLTFWLEPRAQRVCHMNGVNANYMFAIKSLMKASPYRVLTVSLLISVTQMSYCLRMFEGPVTKASGQDYDLISNTIWNIFVTMTTVGYGDLFPKTNIGRIVGIIIAFWGVFIVSLFVVSLSTMLEFDSGEQKAFLLNERLQIKENLRVEAANVLCGAYRQRKVLKEKPVDKDKVLSAFRNFRKYMLKF
mmetsp:Transcript_6748/g.6005  ORF Transcript_6748/g.6005 Transcript_6748/m.6005 type:complete len:262 (-) Transcript_6748:254-1039(-)|eukprot:CAMPEP_0170566086 /NCGR_PEP_ID=MMETSP0211-20121228/79614_1 /TAXON_ID=311385 /ORGANISM="Pseudokeronopsis sp., Strain OXSARD2" /LENGTH=261 /DNA_ID=CAMNT_0010887161 /DNA_START=622 /DNA_END=1407 /DNA_ORIENTATION=+